LTGVGGFLQGLKYSSLYRPSPAEVAALVPVEVVPAPAAVEVPVPAESAAADAISMDIVDAASEPSAAATAAAPAARPPFNSILALMDGKGLLPVPRAPGAAQTEGSAADGASGESGERRVARPTAVPAKDWVNGQVASPFQLLQRERERQRAAAAASANSNNSGNGSSSTGSVPGGYSSHSPVPVVGSSGVPVGGEQQYVQPQPVPAHSVPSAPTHAQHQHQQQHQNQQQHPQQQQQQQLQQQQYQQQLRQQQQLQQQQQQQQLQQQQQQQLQQQQQQQLQQLQQYQRQLPQLPPQ
jgi:hypothetical protein